MFRIKKLALLSLCLFGNIASANPDTHVMVAPHCLLKNSTLQYTQLASTQELSLFTLKENQIDQLVGIKNALRSSCGGFMDVTDAWNKKHHSAQEFLSSFANTKSFKSSHHHYEIQYPEQVKELLYRMDPAYMWERLSHFSSYPDRYANSSNGLKVATEIRDEMLLLANQTGHSKEVSIYFVPTGSFYKQPSVVMKWGNSDEPGIVIGGHMDTLSGIFGVKPGADDDGSGTVAVLETAHTLLWSGMHFKKPIYFVWYAAEEMGLVGSQYVVEDFINKNIAVSDVIQFDMTGYRDQNDPTIWLIKDYVNPDLTAFLEKLITTYIHPWVKYTECGYACSDHATWTLHGFSASMPFESSFGKDNPYIHTSQDTIEKLSLEHMMNYAALGIAFAAELAEPTKSIR